MRRAVSAVALLAATAGCGGSAGGSEGTRSDSGRPSFAAPVVLRHPTPAPPLALRDAASRTVRLEQFRGKAVLLTFVYTHCPDVCPLIVARLHDALARTQAPGAARVVAVSVDPAGDTAAAVRAFLTAHDMRGRMSYLVGTRAQLAPVWRAYGVGVRGGPESREVGHTALVFGIDAAGRRRTLYPTGFTTAQVAHDIPLLAAAR